MTGSNVWKGPFADGLEGQQQARGDTSPAAAREQRVLKRSRLERYIDILEAVNEYGPIRRTHILYKANLSWGDLEDSLGRLEQAGALQRSISKSGVRYDITDAGKKFLANIVTVRELLGPHQSAAGTDSHRI